MKEDVDRCLAAGMDDFISKPVNKQRLLETLTRYLPDNSRKAGMAADQPQQAGTDQAASLLDVQAIEHLAADVTPEVFPEMMQTFIDEMIMRADTITARLEVESLVVLRDEAHTLKSTAVTFGALCMHELARDLEAACRAEHRGLVVRLGKELEVVLQHTLSAYQAYFEYLHVNQKLENLNESTGTRS
jgi:HPt (histidine-containing phosphotransfer) domain-containing protein